VQIIAWNLKKIEICSYAFATN